jgi:beta-galactosidase GanA
VGGRSPDGHVLSANSRYLVLDGTAWFPVTAEFHFSRYPEAHWEEEILKMKAGGVQIISTYIFWIHHEELEGQFDWSGQRNLRRYVWIRVGRWAHGEVRNGGLPDWLLRDHATRQTITDDFFKGTRWAIGLTPTMGARGRSRTRAENPPRTQRCADLLADRHPTLVSFNR